ncbi:autotransporter domain-containing protein [Aromatoleum petrolei]|uniref:Autotransporter domain-containing protein n=1 Tax=Aromatoleum petrolei TaxID=76116 RepID=A0ABX1MTP2_9RHOO|nr:autotransporter domain-containing protein [Aromatoleum petrolei]NMF90595.1 autotransporter domain-containing protein [Aromatoleum petrolei]QTQ37130.1 Outer membrane lipase/esterase [Aromatoleum petrolei]
MTRPILLGIAVAAAFSASATAADFSNMYFFGDSLSDAGSFSALVPPGTGRFTTNPGPVWSENLAAALGTDAVPALAGGTNYAMGGARVTSLPGYPDADPTRFATPIRSQIDAYLASTGGRADPGALYSVWGGANDLFLALETSGNPLGDIVTAATDQVAAVGALKAAGARYILVATMPDIGATPFGVSVGPVNAAGITALSSAYSQVLYGGLAAARIQVIPLDTFSLLREVGADPARYGFANVTTPACGATPSLVCTSADFVAPDADQSFLFADSVHPSTAGHRVIADYALSVLRAPGAVSLLAESPLYTREALYSTVQDQLALSAWARGQSGHNLWASLGGGRVKYSSSEAVPGASGNPYDLAVGVDTWLTPSLSVGAAVGLATLDADFSADGGDYAQREQTVALYAGYRSGALHAMAVGAFGSIDYDIRRDLTLGAAQRAMKGSTSGTNLSLGMFAGYDFTAGALRHGPTLGVHLQQVEVDGFTEKGQSSTTMSFRSQDRNSLLGSVGYRASWNLGRYLPYARVALNHDFEDDDRTVRANLASLPANGFALPAFAPERTWGSAVVGVGAKFSPTLSGNVALSTRVAQDDVRVWALQAGLSLGF